MSALYRQVQLSSMEETWALVAEIAYSLQGKPIGNATGAAILLAYMAVSNEPADLIDHAKAKKIIQDVSLFLSMWDTEGKVN